MNVKTDMSKSQNKTATTHKIIIDKNNPFFLRHTGTKKKKKERKRERKGRKKVDDKGQLIVTVITITTNDFTKL